MEIYIASSRILAELAIRGIKVVVIEKETKWRGEALCTKIELTKEVKKYLTRDEKTIK